MNKLTRVQLDHLDVIHMTGQETIKFLQGQCTQDVSGLEPMNPRLGAFCNAKGRTITNVQIVVLNQESTEALLICSSSAAKILFDHLKKYAAFFRSMKMTFKPGAFVGSGFIGDIQSLETRYQEKLIRLSDEQAMHWRPEEQPLPGYFEDCEEGNQDAWRLLDIQHKNLWLDDQQVEAWIPQNVSLDELDGISFQKGCYTGQEVIARLHYKGQSKKRLFRVEISGGDAAVQDKIYNASKEVGLVIQVAKWQDQQMALVVLKTDQIDQALNLNENQQVLVQVLH